MKVSQLILTSVLIMGFFLPLMQPTPVKAVTDGSFNILEKFQIYQVTPPIKSTDMVKHMEIIGGRPGEYHTIMTSQSTINTLFEIGYTVQLLNDETESLSASFADDYHTFQEMEDMLVVTADVYSDITKLTSIGKSYEERDIWCLEISDNPGIDEDEPGVLFMGLHHAREWPTLEICLYIIELLTDSYQSDPSISSLIDNRRIWIIPCVNPDGYYYCHDLGNDWRKNRHYLEEFSVYGIDLNRNYGGSTNGNPLGMWGSAGMISHLPNNDLYCGSLPFSELETDAIKQFFISHDICTSISWHTYSELVMWPWGFSEDYQTPDDEYLSHVGFEIASKIKKQTGSGHYIPTQSAGLYPTTGDTTDWMYGYSHYVLGRPHFPFTIEACETYHPPASELPQICSENADGALYLLEEAASIHNLKPRVASPIIDNISYNSQGSIEIKWEEVNPLALAEKFELKAYGPIQIHLDDVDSALDVWDMDGFIQTIEDAYSSDYSYVPYPSSNTVSVMMTKYPIPIKREMDLSFYCTYGIEENYDMAFVEISTDGKNFDVLDTFTGYESNWIKKEYSLSKYIGKSIYIRFRYYTDSSGIGRGFFIDDIYPVATYDSITTINDMIIQPEYTINEPSSAVFFQVRGYNDRYGWGDWSILSTIDSTYYYGTPPEIPMIQGPFEAQIGKPITYELRSYDRDNDNLYYSIQWGDGTSDTWIGPFSSNESIYVNHTWETGGIFTIDVQVKDETGLLSDKEYVEVTLSKQKSIIWTLLNFFDFIKDLFQIIFK